MARDPYAQERRALEIALANEQLSIREAALRIGVHHTALSRVLTGERNPSLELSRVIRKRWGVVFG